MKLNQLESSLIKFNTHFVGSFLAAFNKVILKMCLGIFAARGTPLVFEAKVAKSENRLSTANVDTDR